MYPRKIADGGGTEPFHVAHKVPSGDGPYGRAKHAQLVEKDPESAIVWFWKAINDGDRVDSALKDMAVVMKQIDRSEEAIEAIKSFRDRCSDRAQESLDNLLIDLYKKCGMMEEHIELLKEKLRVISRGEGFNGRTTKTARSHGKKFQVSLKQETSRILGNLGWAYMQLSNYNAAEAVYRKARLLDPDFNKCCNLALCLIKQERFDEARAILIEIVQSHQQSSQTQLVANSLAHDRHINQVMELLSEIESSSPRQSGELSISSSEAAIDQNVYNIIAQRLEMAVKEWTPFGYSSFSVNEFDVSFSRSDCVMNNCEVNL